jgi:hypothetical protein
VTDRCFSSSTTPTPPPATAAPDDIETAATRLKDLRDDPGASYRFPDSDREKDR